MAATLCCGFSVAARLTRAAIRCCALPKHYISCCHLHSHIASLCYLICGGSFSHLLCVATLLPHLRCLYLQLSLSLGLLLCYLLLLLLLCYLLLLLLQLFLPRAVWHTGLQLLLSPLVMLLYHLLYHLLYRLLYHLLYHLRSLRTTLARHWPLIAATHQCRIPPYPAVVSPHVPTHVGVVPRHSQVGTDLGTHGGSCCLASMSNMYRPLSRSLHCPFNTP